MALEMLELVSGLPREAIEEMLDKHGVDYYATPGDKAVPNDNYFRSCFISVRPRSSTPDRRAEEMRIVQSAIGPPDEQIKNICHYYALYKMLPGLDVLSLSGKLAFRNGLLAERTSLYF